MEHTQSPPCSVKLSAYGSHSNLHLDRPIVVVGAARSGTTFLGELLGRHPEVTHIPEPRLTWRYGNDSKCDMFSPDDATPEVCKYISESFAFAVRQANKKRLVEKTPSNSLRMGFVERVLPDCLFIHIMRDGFESSLATRDYWHNHAKGVPRDRLYQRLKEVNLKQVRHYAGELLRRAAPGTVFGQPVWGPRIPGMNGLLHDLTLLEVCALQWRTCVESARHYGAKVDKSRYFECKLEEMSPDLVAKLLDFCQLEDSSEVWNAFQSDFRADQTRHRRDKASPEELTLLHKWLDPTMHWLEYEI